MVLRERLQIALDRGKLEKAGQLLEELRALVPEDRELDEVQERILAARAEMERAKEKKQAPEPPPPPPQPKEPPALGKSQREAQRRRIAELIESANSFYQQEKYQRGLEVIDEVLALDPRNEEVLRLQEQVKKAQELAFRIQQEDIRRKAQEAATAPTRPAAEQRAPAAHKDQDFWGTGALPHGDVGYELPPEEKGPVGPPRQPVLYRVVERLSKVKIPVRPLIIFGICVVGFLIGYIVYDSIVNAVTPPQYSLLVLPPSTIAGDSTFLVIADGFAQDLIGDLEGVAALRVIGGTTALGLRNSSLSVPQMARSVGANYYLQWSMLRSPEGIAVQPSVHDTLSENATWVSRYQIQPAGLAGLRNELVHRIVAAVGVPVTDEEDAALRKTPTLNSTAYEAYLRGRAMLRQPHRYRLEDAIALFAQAAQADSQFADAQVAMGWARILEYESAPEVAPSLLADASRCVEHAVYLGSRSAEVFRVWGMIEEFRSQYPRAIERLEQAVRISPSDAESQRRLAVAYVTRGLLDAAVKAAGRAVADDPGNIDSYTTLGLVQQVRGDYRGAFQSYEQGLHLARDRSEYASSFYADVLVYLKRFDTAVDILTDRIARVKDSDVDSYKLGRVAQSAGRPKPEVQSAFLRSKTILTDYLAVHPDDARAYSLLALVETRLGEFKDAIGANNKAQHLAPNDVDVLYNTAKMYAIQLDRAKALEYLSKAAHERFSLSAILDMDFHNLHSEPDFISSITR